MNSITIECVHDRGRPTKVATLSRTVFPWNASGHTYPAGTWSASLHSARSAGQTVHQVSGPSSVELLGDQVVPILTGRDVMDGRTPETNRRERYSFECPRCGLAFAVRGERLERVLNQLVDAGCERISMGGLMRVLT